MKETIDKILQHLDSIFRWAHVIAGVLWIGLLYFFNWVNSAFAPTLDAETKKKVIPELIPRTLFWFRWGAAWTWITGALLLFVSFYHFGLSWDGAAPFQEHAYWLVAIIGLIGLTVLYDFLVGGPLKAPEASFWGGLVLASAVPYLLRFGLGFSFRGSMIHLGAMFGTFMAFNVWMRIWPAQIKVITAIKNGEAPDADLAKLAGTRSKHNTYMSFPLIFAMVNGHHVIMAPRPAGDGWKFSPYELIYPAFIFVGWAVCWMCYKKAKKVPGF